MKQRSGSSSLSALKLKSFSSLVKWWARIIHITWKVTCLYGIFTGCVWTHADSGKSLAVWMQQIWRSGNKCRNTLPVYFPESLCERHICNIYCWCLVIFMCRWSGFWLLYSPSALQVSPAPPSRAWSSRWSDSRYHCCRGTADGQGNISHATESSHTKHCSFVDVVPLSVWHVVWYGCDVCGLSVGASLFF